MVRNSIDGEEYEATYTGGSHGTGSGTPTEDLPMKRTVRVTRLSDGAIGHVSLGPAVELGALSEDQLRSMVSKAFGRG